MPLRIKPHRASNSTRARLGRGTAFGGRVDRAPGFGAWAGGHPLRHGVALCRFIGSASLLSANPLFVPYAGKCVRPGEKPDRLRIVRCTGRTRERGSEHGSPSAQFPVPHFPCSSVFWTISHTADSWLAKTTKRGRGENPPADLTGGGPSATGVGPPAVESGLGFGKEPPRAPQHHHYHYTARSAATTRKKLAPSLCPAWPIRRKRNADRLPEWQLGGGTVRVQHTQAPAPARQPNRGRQPVRPRLARSATRGRPA